MTLNRRSRDVKILLLTRERTKSKKTSQLKNYISKLITIQSNT